MSDNSPGEARIILDLSAVDAFAERAHRGQKRNTGDDTAPELAYIVHPRAVRAFLEDEHPDPGLREPWVLATALLHDVLEDCDVHHHEVTAQFGADVSAACRALSKQLKADPRALKTPEQYWAVLADAPLAVRQIKGADRVDNLRSCLRWPRPKLVAKYLVETPRYVLPMVAEDAFLYALLCELLAQMARAYRP
jgi:GTP pyrophosphokinase